MTRGDEILDYLRHKDERRRAAKPKPKYFWGDRRELDEAGITSRVPYSDIPEEQFWNPPK